jgi:small GTP-binding protein
MLAEPVKNSKTFKKEKPNKVVIIGDSNVGKTCLIERYCENKFGDTQPTIGALHKVKTVNDVELDIWDTAGQERFKSMIPMYYKGARAIIVAFDLTSMNSFEGAKKWIQEIEANISNIIVVIVGNKVDLIQKRVVNKENAKNYADQKGFMYYETSAKDNVGVFDVFDSIAIKLKEMNIKNESNIKIQNGSQEENKSGCACG